MWDARSSYTNASYKNSTKRRNLFIAKRTKLILSGVNGELGLERKGNIQHVLVVTVGKDGCDC